jgi:copper(I)-binding protein
MRTYLLAALLLAAPACAHAQGVSVDHPWARATAPSAKTGGVFLTLKPGATPDRLVGATTPVAGMAELHRTVNEGGVMKMRPVDALPVDPGRPVELKPGGVHIMLMGLKQQLRQGESFPITLRFEKAPPVTATVTVAGPGAAGPATDMHSGHMAPKP